ncbi:hypothetical protein I79_017585 [Cricetulus griseus]|uniref:Uncharacterized protein n=1 Tax=Cricetulus griseus TaxID=10029 RepID=G3I2H8_CRIGR|nr:hypothetical protein I79_017585 [Cricetulus griseus]
MSSAFLPNTVSQFSSLSLCSRSNPIICFFSPQCFLLPTNLQLLLSGPYWKLNL